MRILRNYLLLALFTVAPLLGAIAAEYIAKAYGSRVDEAGVHPCYIHGVDVGLPLSILFTAGWFSLVTIPAGVFAMVAYTVQQFARLFSRKKA